MDLLQRFREFIYADCKLPAGETWLLAVSGGLDSVALCELCHQAGQPFSIIHANFQLRGEESTRDEAFVSGLAKKYDCDVYINKFETQSYATQNKLSIQVAARELRYRWFHNTLGTNAHRLHRIATAHHRDDNIETILMNFFKGSGIAGLRGILPVQDKLIRPLLFASKEELRAFAAQHGLHWVEDSSNATDKYTRNYFRHQLIPIIKETMPEAEANLAANAARFRDIETLYHQSITHHKSKLIEKRGAETFIPVLRLAKSTPLHTIVYEIIKDLGFTAHQTQVVIDLLDSPSGKFVRSATHRILRDRVWLIITPLEDLPAAHILIESPGHPVPYDNGVLTLNLETLSPQLRSTLLPQPESLKSSTGDNSQHPENPKGPTIDNTRDTQTPKASANESGPQPENPENATGKPGSPNKQSQPRKAPRTDTNSLIAYVDASEIRFPLLLRKWRTGDYFYPLGMPKKKKLGRFFIDNKLSLARKEKIWVLEMDKKIVWVIGMRIDDRFKISPQTKNILKIETRLT